LTQKAIDQALKHLSDFDDLAQKRFSVSDRDCAYIPADHYTMLQLGR